MKNEVEQIKNDLEFYFSTNANMQEYQINFILYDRYTRTFNVLASNDDDIILFSPYGKDKIYEKLPDWDFSFDEYFFGELSDRCEIKYISDDTHYALWNDIENSYPYDINSKDGVQKYLQYCRDNEVTREYLDQEFKIDIPDVMRFYEYPEGYIKVEDNKVIMSKETYEHQGELSYLTFILGYDLLNKKLKESNYQECDISYEACNSIANVFMQSDEYYNISKSTYEILEEWLNDNPYIIKTYLTKGENLKLKNATLIDVGYRKGQPVALVSKNDENIIAFNYIVKDDNIEWAYGKYYGNDFNKANYDFQKVISGGNLCLDDERSER